MNLSSADSRDQTLCEQECPNSAGGEEMVDGRKRIPDTHNYEKGENEEIDQANKSDCSCTFNGGNQFAIRFENKLTDTGTSNGRRLRNV